MSLHHLLRLAGAVLAAVTAILAMHANWTEWRSWRAADAGSRALADLRLGLAAAERVSRERGPTNARLGASDGPADPASVTALAQAREATDLALEQLRTAVAGLAPSARTAALPYVVDEAAQALVRARTVACLLYTSPSPRD